nr:hypothetical protein L195_g004243 [Ipomoea batatas]
MMIGTHPETRAPVPSRNNSAREAPNMSNNLSPLTLKGLGCGALKLGGAENEAPDFVLTEVETVGFSEDALTKNTLLLRELDTAAFRVESGPATGVAAKFRAPYMAASPGKLRPEISAVYGGGVVEWYV